MMMRYLWQDHFHPLSVHVIYSIDLIVNMSLRQWHNLVLSQAEVILKRSSNRYILVITMKRHTISKGIVANDEVDMEDFEDDELDGTGGMTHEQSRLF